MRQITGNLLRPGGLELTRQGLELCSFAPGARLLDAGCGPGASLALLKERGFTCLGLDRSPILLREAAAHAPCLLADVARIPLRDKSLDGIICECVLSLARNKAAVLREFHRLLRPGGKVLFSDLTRSFGRAPRACPETAREKDAKGGCAIPCAQGALWPDQLLALWRDAGFSPLFCEDKTPLLRSLAAQIVWRFGSLSAFSALWYDEAPCAAGQSAGHTAATPGPPAGTGLGYLLIIMERTGG